MNSDIPLDLSTEPHRDPDQGREPSEHFISSHIRLMTPLW